MEQFTTFDINRTFGPGFKIDMLKDWQKRGFITPSIQRARGVGTKNLFSRDDLYRIVLFKHLLDRGIAREQANQIMKAIEYSNAPLGDYYIFAKEKSFPVQGITEYRIDGRMVSTEVFEKKSISEIFDGSQLDFDDIFVLNIKKIKAFVDKETM